MWQRYNSKLAYAIPGNTASVPQQVSFGFWSKDNIWTNFGSGCSTRHPSIPRESTLVSVSEAHGPTQSDLSFGNHFSTRRSAQNSIGASTGPNLSADLSPALPGDYNAARTVMDQQELTHTQQNKVTQADSVGLSDLLSSTLSSSPQKHSPVMAVDFYVPTRPMSPTELALSSSGDFTDFLQWEPPIIPMNSMSSHHPTGLPAHWLQTSLKLNGTSGDFPYFSLNQSLYYHINT